MTRLLAPVTEGRKALKALGIRRKDVQENLLNFVDIIEQLRKSFEGMGDAKQAEYIKALFGQEQLTNRKRIDKCGRRRF
jgi:TP901 family phage tail tape measure protein